MWPSGGGPKGFTTRVTELDLRVGGVLCIHLRGPDGIVYPCKGVYCEILEPERIIYRGAVEEGSTGCGAGLPPQAMVTITFAEHSGGKTLLTMHTRFESVADCDAAVESGFTAGWADSFDDLEEFLAKT